MKDRFDDTPVACSLTTVELRDREATLLTQFRSAIIETEEFQEGYAFRLPGDGRSHEKASALRLSFSEKK